MKGNPMKTPQELFAEFDTKIRKGIIARPTPEERRRRGFTPLAFIFGHITMTGKFRSKSVGKRARQ
jgi:hypothetical protein